MAMERLACFGEGETPRRAVDEAYSELGLQRGDAAAKLRGLQAQCFRRCRIGAEIDDFGEEIEVVEVLNGSHAASLDYSIYNKYVFHFRGLSRGSLHRYVFCTGRQIGGHVRQHMKIPAPRADRVRAESRSAHLSSRNRQGREALLAPSS